MSPKVVGPVVAYVRVSTRRQDQSGLGLEAQVQAIEAGCKHRGWAIAKVYKDAASGRSRKGRPQLEAALAELKAGRASGLVVAKLDRLARSTVDFGNILKLAQKEGWVLTVLDMDIDTSTPTGELIGNVVASVAQWESRMIALRIHDVLVIKRQRGDRLGRARLISPELETRIRRLRTRSGLSYEAIAAKLNGENLPAPSGSVWRWQTISRVAKRGPVRKGTALPA